MPKKLISKPLTSFNWVVMIVKSSKKAGVKFVRNINAKEQYLKISGRWNPVTVWVTGRRYIPMHIKQDVREDVFFILSEKFLNSFKNWVLGLA